MKKITLLLLTILLFSLLYACGSEGNSDKSVLKKDGQNVLNEAALSNCIVEVVELTTENWNEYITPISYTATVEYKDAFGDTQTKEVSRCVWGAELEQYYRYEGVVIELTNTETGAKEILDFDSYRTVWDEISVDNHLKTENLECTRIKGKVYILSIPEEVIHPNTSTHVAYPFMNEFIVWSKHQSYRCTINAETNQVIYYGNWEQYLE